MQTSTSIIGQPMARRRKAGRPAISTRDDVAVKLDRNVVAKARFVAETKRVPLAEYLSEALRPIVGKDFDRIVRATETEGGGK